MTVPENVAYGLRVNACGAPSSAARVHRRRSRWCGWPSSPTRKPGQLSGGQRQRVALARAIVNEPEVLLLDEPLGALDLKLRQEMQVELKRIQREIGITFIYVTHDQEEALTMSDRLAVFSDGRIEQVGTPAEVYEQPGDRVRRRLRRRLERHRARGSRGSRSDPRRSALDPGDPLAAGHHARAGTVDRRRLSRHRSRATSSRSTAASTLTALRQNQETAEAGTQLALEPEVAATWLAIDRRFTIKHTPT